MTTIPDTPNEPSNNTPARVSPATLEEFLSHIRAIKDMMGNFSFDRPSERRRFTLNASVTDQFVEETAVAIEASPFLAGALDYSANDLRDALNFARLLLPVADELRLIERGVRYTIAERRAWVGQRAMHAYSLSNKLNSLGGRDIVVPHADAMRRAFGPRANRKAKVEPTQPAPQPAASSSASTQTSPQPAPPSVTGQPPSTTPPNGGAK